MIKWGKNCWDKKALIGESVLWGHALRAKLRSHYSQASLILFLQDDGMTTLAEFNKQQMTDMLRRAKTMSTSQLAKEVLSRTLTHIAANQFLLWIFSVKQCLVL